MSDSVSVENGQQSSKLPFIIIGLIVLLFGGAAAFLFLTPMGKSLIGMEEESSDPASVKIDIHKVAFTPLPEILINLRSADGRSSFLKASFIIESPTEEIGKKIDKIKPMLVDQFQVFLRELDTDDLKGSAGMMRIRQELLTRANAVISPDKVSNVLFKEFLIQ